MKDDTKGEREHKGSRLEMVLLFATVGFDVRLDVFLLVMSFTDGPAEEDSEKETGDVGPVTTTDDDMTNNTIVLHDDHNDIATEVATEGSGMAPSTELLAGSSGNTSDDMAPEGDHDESMEVDPPAAPLGSQEEEEEGGNITHNQQDDPGRSMV